MSQYVVARVCQERRWRDPLNMSLTNGKTRYLVEIPSSVALSVGDHGHRIYYVCTLGYNRSDP
jgi:hypothetical protein